MAFGLIIIGDEILSGRRSDKHLPKVIELLGERGLQLAWAEIVGDDRARITALLERSFAGPDIVFSCGGIGRPRTTTPAGLADDRLGARHPLPGAVPPRSAD